MCYSAQIRADYHRFMRRFGAKLSLRDFFNLYWLPEQERGKPPRTPKAMDAMFAVVEDADDVREAIAARNAREIAELEADLFRQRARLAKAERALANKPTKTAAEEMRKATKQAATRLRQLDRLKRSTLRPEDGRFFPDWYAPVLIVENGQRVIKPMRYHCRPAGMSPASDRTKDGKLSGTFNARRDNLERFWRKQFAHTHGIIVVERFYEAVTGPDGRSRELEFAPQSGEPMILACLWSHWTDPSGKLPDLWSFAAITDEPPPEVAAAGHDRCLIPLREQHVEAWLNPAGDVARMQAILDDRERYYYEHRQVA